MHHLTGLMDHRVLSLVAPSCRHRPGGRRRVRDRGAMAALRAEVVGHHLDTWAQEQAKEGGKNM